MVPILFPFGCIYQTIREGRVTGWRETLSGGIVSSLSVPLSMVGDGFPLYPSSIPRERPPARRYRGEIGNRPERMGETLSGISVLLYYRFIGTPSGDPIGRAVRVCAAPVPSPVLSIPPPSPERVPARI